MIKKFFYKHILLVIVLIILITSAIITSCKCRACSNQGETVVPDEILAKANTFITVSTGKDFFEKYITPDFFKTRHTPPYYEMAYKFFMPEKPYVNAVIKFTVDSLGNVMKNRDIVGIPKCINFPEQCVFNIDEQTARQIASDNALNEGIRDWDTGFSWDFKMKRYVWRILSTLTEFGEGDHYKASGQEIVIDPNTGEILAFNDWRVN
jgi:hypothetical protein